MGWTTDVLLLYSWDKICLAKEAGGLGVLDVQTQNKALLMKDLHNFFNSSDLPWVDLMWSSYYTSTPSSCHTCWFLLVEVYSQINP